MSAMALPASRASAPSARSIGFAGSNWSWAGCTGGTRLSGWAAAVCARPRNNAATPGLSVQCLIVAAPMQVPYWPPSNLSLEPLPLRLSHRPRVVAGMFPA